MTRRSTYVVTIDGSEWKVSGELPVGTFDDVEIGLYTGPGTRRPLGPNYDGSSNSIMAAQMYKSYRRPVAWLVWDYLYARNTQWTNGRLLDERFGTEALRRFRDLRYLNWPVQCEPRGKGPWWYRLDLATPRRIIPRSDS